MVYEDVGVAKVFKKAPTLDKGSLVEINQVRHKELQSHRKDFGNEFPHAVNQAYWTEILCNQSFFLLRN